MPSPDKLAHVVFKTCQISTMVNWYCDVLEGRVAFKNDVIAFITYDAEHHRVAFVATGGDLRPTPSHTGLHHVAFTYATLSDLLATYRRLRNTGTHPFWCVNHGPTTSMYFEDPDGNHVELQSDNFATPHELEEWFASGAFEINPIGTTFDPEDLLDQHLAERFKRGAPLGELVKQR
ncbi:VOC family protein [Mycobacterium sp. ML4]